MPRKKEGEGKRYPLNMRTTKEVREMLELAARKSGRSLVQEVEWRLALSFDHQGLLEEALTLAYGKPFAKTFLAEAEQLQLMLNHRKWRILKRVFAEAVAEDAASIETKKYA